MWELGWDAGRVKVRRVMGSEGSVESWVRQGEGGLEGVDWESFEEGVLGEVEDGGEYA